jgi:hypothetical protein
MTIAHSEEMSEVAPVEIRTQYKCVLVYLIWIVGYKSNSCSECILSDYISFNELWLN